MRDIKKFKNIKRILDRNKIMDSTSSKDKLKLNIILRTFILHTHIFKQIAKFMLITTARTIIA